jgi:hypothetical protein
MVEVDLDSIPFDRLFGLLEVFKILGESHKEERETVVDAIFRRLAAKGVCTVERRNGQLSFGPGTLFEAGFTVDQVLAALRTETQ